MALSDFVARLPPKQQVKLAIHFCRLALPVWEEYAAHNPLKYRDSVVGMEHTVEKNILEKALEAAGDFIQKDAVEPFWAGKVPLLKVRSTFDEPIVALQDSDWEPPYVVARTIYAVYNLLQWLLGERGSIPGESLLYVAANQAIDALLEAKKNTVDELNAVLATFET